MTGEWLSQAGWPNPSRPGPQGQETGGRIHQFLWRRSRAVSNANRNEAARRDEKPRRVESSSRGTFRSPVNRSYPEGKWLLLCISTGRMTLAFPTRDPPNERRRKAGQNERSDREGHQAQARPVKTFRNAGDVKNSAAGL